MQRSDARPPVCPSVHRRSLLLGRFVALGPVGRRYRSTATAARCLMANASSVTLLADVGSWTQTCYYYAGRVCGSRIKTVPCPSVARTRQPSSVGQCVGPLCWLHDTRTASILVRLWGGPTCLLHVSLLILHRKICLHVAILLLSLHQGRQRRAVYLVRHIVQFQSTSRHVTAEVTCRRFKAQLVFICVLFLPHDAYAVSLHTVCTAR